MAGRKPDAGVPVLFDADLVRSRAINRMHSKRNEVWAARGIFKPRSPAFIWWNFRNVRPIRYTYWKRADTRLMSAKRRRKFIVIIVMISAHFHCYYTLAKNCSSQFRFYLIVAEFFYMRYHHRIGAV